MGVTFLKVQQPTINRCFETEKLLVSGGDSRLTIDPSSGVNKYGCQAFPDTTLLAFGSSTASVISTTGYEIAQRLQFQMQAALQAGTLATVYQQQLKQLSIDWLKACDLADYPGLKLIFSASGTDLHGMITPHLSKNESSAPLVIMVEANETGSGVCPALANGNNTEVKQVSLRLEDGSPRSIEDIDGQVASWVAEAVAVNRKVLLIMVDQSKTGLIAPSPECVLALKQSNPDLITVMVDACQFRLHTTTLNSYLQLGFMVALTGSKFLTAPSFSAALLVPDSVKCFLNDQSLVEPNVGLLLRIAVALEELRRFRNIPTAKVILMMDAFSQAILNKLNNEPHFELLRAPALERKGLLTTKSWDHLQTIFPFVLYHQKPSGRVPLSRVETLKLYQKKQSGIRWQLGQPVACGSRQGIEVSALRLCISSRLIVEAASIDSLIDDALMTLSLVKRAIQNLD